MSLDASLIGLVFSFILFIIFFSAIILYLAFRIKETFRSERKRSVLVIKIFFLVGVLFLAGGVFYFFANMLRSPTSLTPFPGDQVLNLTASYPSSVKVNTVFTVSFTVVNPSVSTAHGVTIQACVLFESFTIRSSTHEIVGNVINVGNVSPGTTIVSLELYAPGRAGKVSGEVNLLFQEMKSPVTQEITITVRGGP